DRAVLLVEDENLTRVARAGRVAKGSPQHETIARNGERGPEVVPSTRIRVEEDLEEGAGRVGEVGGSPVVGSEIIERGADQQVGTPRRNCASELRASRGR